MKRSFSVAILVIVVFNLSAQVETRTTNDEILNNHLRLNQKGLTDSYKLPVVDREKLLLEDEADKSAGLPFRFGHIF